MAMNVVATMSCIGEMLRQLDHGLKSDTLLHLRTHPIRIIHDLAGFPELRADEFGCLLESVLDIR